MNPNNNEYNMQMLKRIKQTTAINNNGASVGSGSNKFLSSASSSDSIRAMFKESLNKLTQISTRDQAFKQLKTLILQNKTTTNLRIWLSVLSQNRNKHHQSQISVLGFLIEQYGSGLLDPLDKVPSLQKTAFRVTELIMKAFQDSQISLQLACQKTWVQLYLSSLFKQSTQLKKKLLFTNLQSMINGGGGKISQTTAQFAIDGLLQASLNKQDLQFFKEIAKRTLVLFLKTTVIHYSVLTSLQTILSFFGINNLIPLLDNICSKINTYISQAPPNSLGYKIKSECCNAFGLIGQQIDKNGLSVYEKVVKVLEDQATDKVWAVQATGRKALSIWRAKKQEWETEFLQKQERLGEQIQSMTVLQNQQQLQHQNNQQLPIKTSQNYYQRNNQNQQSSTSQQQQFVRTNKNSQNQRPFTHQNNYMPAQSHSQSQSRGVPLILEPPRQQTSAINQAVHKSYNEGFFNPNPNINPSANYYDPNSKYLHKNTGVGGGNNIQTAQNFYNRPFQQQTDTHARKMEQIKKSIYNQDKKPAMMNDLGGDQYDETVPWEQAKSLPNFKDWKHNQQQQPNPKQHQFDGHGRGAMSQMHGGNNNDHNQSQPPVDTQFVEEWERIVEIYEKGDKQTAVKELLQMDDDIYFLRFLLQNGQGLMKDLTRNTSAKLLKKILSIQKTNFMEQMLFKMVAQTSKIKAGQILTNTQNLQIIRNLEKCQKKSGLQVISQKLKGIYQKSLTN